MSAQLERLVLEWRDSEMERSTVLHQARIHRDEILPIDVARANERAASAAAALMRYANEEMG